MDKTEPRATLAAHTFLVSVLSLIACVDTWVRDNAVLWEARR